MQRVELINNLELALPKMTEEEQEKAKRYIVEERQRLASEDFYSFVKIIAPEIIPGGKFIDGRHLRLYCNELQNLYETVASGGNYKLQFHLPPGAMKTLIACLFVAWVLGRSPEFYILHIGHTVKFAEETFGQRIKDIILLPAYRFIFPKTVLSKTTRSKGTWKTTKGGTYHATGAGNAIAGKRAHILICDDVLSEQTAMSKTERNKINEWYIPGARSRLLPSSAELIVNCVTADTMMKMADGSEKPIVDVKVGEKVLSYCLKSDRLEPKAVLATHDNGLDEIWKIELKNGYKLECNSKHPFLTEDNVWVKAKDLVVGQKVKVANRLNDDTILTNQTISETEAYLLGFMIGDGWLINSKRSETVRRHVTCWAYGVDEKLNQNVLDKMEQLFGGQYFKKTKYGYYRSDKNNVCNKFINLGITPSVGAKFKRIPEYVFSEPEVIREEVFKGLIDSDGHIDKKGMVRFGNHNKNLTIDIKRLADSLGYKTSRIVHRTGTSQPPNSPAPVEYNQYWLSIGKTKNNNSWLYRRVESVENTGRKENVYDLTVEDNYNFVTNGIVTYDTRWFMDDLSGYIIKLDKAAKQPEWKIISIPAILEGPEGEKMAEILGLPIGSSYWPEFWPLATFEGTKKSAAPHVWNSLYMQNPTPADGIVFKKESFEFLDEFESGTPTPSLMVLSMDTAFSKDKKADFSAWQVWGIFLDNKNDRQVQQVMLYEAGKDRLSYPELVLKSKELHEKYDIKYMIVEKKASGQSLIQDLIMQGYSVHAFDPGRDDKLTRANMVTPFLDAGLIWIPKHASWSKDFLQECLEFPSGAHDDQVDCFTQTILWLRNKLLLKHSGNVTMTDEDDEDFDPHYNNRTTYWSAVAGRNK